MYGCTGQGPKKNANSFVIRTTEASHEYAGFNAAADSSSSFFSFFPFSPCRPPASPLCCLLLSLCSAAFSASDIGGSGMWWCEVPVDGACDPRSCSAFATLLLTTATATAARTRAMASSPIGPHSPSATCTASFAKRRSPMRLAV